MSQMSQINPGIILTGSQNEANSLSRQYPGLSIEYCFAVTKPVTDKEM